jgi:hypothetical protein
VTCATLAAGQAHLDALVVERDMLIQPFFTSVTTTGERSLASFDGDLSHTCLRRPALGESHAADTRLTPKDAEEAAVVGRVMEAVNGETPCARVAIAPDEA